MEMLSISIPGKAAALVVEHCCGDFGIGDQ
jgi:hypothetical protein